MGSSLGAPKRYFPIKNLNRVDSLVVFFFLLGCFILVFLDGLSISYLPYLKHGPVMIEDSLAAPGFVAFVLFLTGLAAGWWHTRTGARAWLYMTGDSPSMTGMDSSSGAGRILFHWPQQLPVPVRVDFPLV